MRSTWVLLGLVVSASVLLAAEPIPPGADPTEPPQPYVEPETGIVFPQRLGVLVLQGVQKYEEAGLGISVAYDCSDPIRVVVDIYIYDFGRKDIGTGVESEAVKQHFGEVQGHLHAMEERGRYKTVKKLSEESVSVQVGDKPLALLHAIFEYTNVPAPGSDAPERPVKSHILLTGFKDRFLKVRFTYPQAKKADGDKVFAEFLPILGQMLSSAGAGAGSPSEPEPKESPLEPEAPSDEAEPAPSPAVR
ncbi:MAG TPA: hypothetical protein VM219_06195 [Phycisphaerae bacterium]|nr:hypothetical protein [Phycisphaerae bacterium]